MKYGILLLKPIRSGGPRSPLRPTSSATGPRGWRNTSRSAFAAYGGNLVNGVPTAVGWVAGKLLERAGANLPDPPTSEAILRGLWSVSNDNLGGLTEP